MKTYPAYPIVTASQNNKFILAEPYKVKNILIPKNFKSDGLTLKFRFFRLFVAKDAPKFMPFFILHDYLCDRKKFLLADNLGQKVLFEIEESFRTKIMMFVIKKYHYLKYGVKYER